MIEGAGRLEALRASGALDGLDVHFAALLARLGVAADGAVCLAAALASRRAVEGHVCLELATVAGHEVGEGTRVAAPPIDAWRAALRASPAVGAGNDGRPLVLDDADRLYLARHFRLERDLASRLLARAEEEVPAVDDVRLRDAIDRLFPGAAADGAADGQRMAAAVAALRRLCVVSGGPGTGKTTTVVRILALLATLAPEGEPPPRAALAAPTGKAAARIRDVVRAALPALPEAVRGAVPDEAWTLHRLIGARPGASPRRHAGRPLPLDVLVIDEASMVDLALMARTVEALPRGARLVLLGDKDQLASVEAGAVLADICGDADGPRPGFAARLASLCGGTVAGASRDAPAMRDAVVLLERSHRFAAAGGIGMAAGAVRAGDAEAVLAALGEGGAPEASLLRGADRDALASEAAAGFAPFLDAVAGGEPPDAVLVALDRFRVLCAHRRGPLGVEDLNALLETRLREEGRVAGRDVWYPGRPVMVARNDHAQRLFNGDTGVALRDPDAGDGIRVFFPAPDGGVRGVSPGRLPEHETAWAVTVHKSQGSEFDEVLVVLPAADSPVLTRELVYTALTRARRAVRVSADPVLLASAIERRLRRASGLRDALWGGDEGTGRG